MSSSSTSWVPPCPMAEAEEQQQQDTSWCCRPGCRRWGAGCLWDAEGALVILYLVIHGLVIPVTAPCLSGCEARCVFPSHPGNTKGCCILACLHRAAQSAPCKPRGKVFLVLAVGR